MRNIDFLISDMDSSSDWVKTAPAENYQYSLGMKEIEKALNSKGEGSSTMKMGGYEDGDMPGGTDPNGNFTWSQTAVNVSHRKKKS
jgi:hypothetical protein